MNESKRIYSLDTIKSIAAFLVVSLHVPSLPIPLIPRFIPDIARVAVPLFLMISGYFIYSTDIDKLFEKTKIGIYRILKLLGVGFVVYLIVYIITFRDWLGVTKELSYLLSFKFWFFGQVPFCPIAWYLVAYLYSLMIYAFLRKIKASDITFFCLAFVCIFIWLSTGSYQSFFFTETIPWMYNTSWIMAFPFFILGIYMKIYETRILNFKITNILYYTLIFIFVLLSFAEYFLIGKINSVSVNGTAYISTVFLVFFIFSFAQSNKKFGAGTILNTIGREYSLYIYLYHVAINYLLCSFFIVHFSFINRFSFEPIIRLPFNYRFLINNFSVFLLSTIISYLLYRKSVSKN